MFVGIAFLPHQTFGAQGTALCAGVAGNPLAVGPLWYVYGIIPVTNTGTPQVPGKADGICFSNLGAPGTGIISVNANIGPADTGVLKNAQGCTNPNPVVTLTPNAGPNLVWADWASDCANSGDQVTIVFACPAGCVAGAVNINAHFSMPADVNNNFNNAYTGPCQSSSGPCTLTKFVGGSIVPTSKLALLTPYIGIASVISATTIMAAIYVKRFKGRRTEED